ncbi:MAG: hypothetical protein V1720_17075 [bacterium]
MKKIAKLFFVVAMMSLLSGCIDVTMKVKVNPDGSGVIEETVLMGGTFIEMMNQMMSFMDTTGTQKFEIFKEDELMNEAAEYGEGVKYLKGEKIDAGGKSGYKAVFSFTDITKLKIDEDPVSKVPSDAMSMSDQEPQEKKPITFAFEKGTTSKLTIILPEFDKSGIDDEQAVEDTAQAMDPAWEEQAKTMMKDMHIAILVQPMGTITSTNATNVENNVITLMEMDFGKILEQPGKFDELKKHNPKSFEEAKEMLKDIPGIKMEFNQKVEVSFK